MTTRQQRTLFDGDPASQAPLAERMRPRSVDELVGAEGVLADSTFLGRMLRGGAVRSLILWGPPGCGKTTVARLLAERADAELETLSAVLAGIKDLREVVARAEQRKQRENRATILSSTRFIASTRRSRTRFCRMSRPERDLGGRPPEPVLRGDRASALAAASSCSSRSRSCPRRLVDRALSDASAPRHDGAGDRADARRFIADSARGDARTALGALEASADLARETSAKAITLAIAEQGVQQKALLYDKGGEEHYNVISAFIKSMRGGDADAAVYWLTRMLEAGEEPLFIARRMVIFASEDVGLADPNALPLAIAVKDAVHFIGLPEARINLAHGAAYLALAPKSNASYAALGEASAEVKRSGALPVPKHLRNAPTGLMRELGYGRGYVYPHGREQEAAGQSYLPAALSGRKFLKKP
jgi:putative ATPase